ncbi:hypothetical protein LDENG_00015170 [Lucifuga dentata]|nr:hypothetical protein LDENG_00015170 [Lucifuga dentata]
MVHNRVQTQFTSSPSPLPSYLREVLSWTILKTFLRQFACYLALHMLCIWITQNAWLSYQIALGSLCNHCCMREK